MLTKSERQWAINAKMRLSHKDDFRCGKCGVHCYVPYAPCMCVITKEDVAWEIEFQSRMAAKMAKVIARLVKEEPWSDVEAQATTPDLVLKWARLSVEEEMNGKKDNS